MHDHAFGQDEKKSGQRKTLIVVAMIVKAYGHFTTCAGALCFAACRPRFERERIRFAPAVENLAANSPTLC